VIQFAIAFAGLWPGQRFLAYCRRRLVLIRPNLAAAIAKLGLLVPKPTAGLPGPSHA